MMRPSFIIMIALIWAALWTPGCSKKEEASQTPSTRKTQPATGPATAGNAAIHPVPQLKERLAQPSVTISINGSNDIKVPQGWPLLIRATVLGGKDMNGPSTRERLAAANGRGHPIEVPADSVTLRISDAKGAQLAWNPKACKSATTQPWPRRADETHGVSFTWVIADTTTLAPGAYRINPMLAGANSTDAGITIVAPLDRPTPDQLANQFALRVSTLVASGEADAALKLADERVEAMPTDVVAHQTRGLALAALGRRDDAIRSYEKALMFYTIQNPNSEEPPLVLMRAIENLRRQK